MVLPGAGQVFLRRVGRAVGCFVGSTFLVICFWPLRLPHSYPGLIFAIWVCVLLSFFSFCDALFSKDPVAAARISAWWVLATFPLSYIGVNVIFTALLFGSGFRTMRLASSSMEPMLKLRETLVADMHYYREHPKTRDDVVVIHRGWDIVPSQPRDSKDVVIIKRIIAIGGDTIEGKEQQIFLNGSIQNESFIQQHKFKIGSDSDLDTFGPITVPPGKFFVMGDNRDISLDSRYSSFGLVDDNSIVGKPLYAYRIRGNPKSRRLD